MKRPVILGIAITNRPHLRLREHPLSIVDKKWFESNNITPARELQEDEKLVRVPVLVKGKYKHPYGELNFDDTAISKMLEHVTNKIGDFEEGLDYQHKPDRKEGMLAWFSESEGGWLSLENNVLVGYGVPTGDEVLNIVDKKKFKYASLEFHPNYRSNVSKTYLSQDFYEEDTMSDVTLTKEEYEALLADKTKLSDLESKLAELTGKIETAETKVAETTEALNQANTELEAAKNKIVKLEGVEEEEDDPKIIALQNKVAELSKQSLVREVDLIITKAKLPNDKGQAHAPAVLDAFQALMLGNALGDEVVKLENGVDPEAIGKYTRDWAKHVLLEIMPRTVQLENQIDIVETPSVAQETEMLTKGTEFGKSFWGGVNV